MNNTSIINKAAITTDSLASGLLNPSQANKFVKMVFEATPLSSQVRHELRAAKTGEIDKIGIGSRLLRKKVENTDDGYRVQPEHSVIEYATTAVRLPWEITEETLRQNIEGENYEAIVTELMTRQVGIDQEDICLNGDTATASTDDDYDFLKLNDGWIKQITNAGHVFDHSTVNSGKINLDTFYDMLQMLPNKYNNGQLRWLMSPHRRQEWERYFLAEAIGTGGVINDRMLQNPVSVPVIEVPAIPDDKIILANPKNLVIVNSYDIKIRKTTEGKDAIMQDKRFYVIHFDFDPVIEETDAVGIITGLA